MKIATERVTLQIADGTSMNAYTARPAEEGRFPGILVFQEAFGVNAHIRDITERIAEKDMSLLRRSYSIAQPQGLRAAIPTEPPSCPTCRR